MKYKELKENLNELNEDQLDADVLIWSTEDAFFYDNIEYNYKGNIEIAKLVD